MNIRHFHLGSRALVVAALAVSGIAFAGAPMTASAAVVAHTATPQCGPKVATHYQAPGVGVSATYTADSAGSVTLLDQGVGTLKVTHVSHKSKWMDTVITGTGTTIHVGFQGIGAPQEKERFWARLNSSFTVITIVIQSCT